MFKIIGWDIGAANIKAAFVAFEKEIEVRSVVASQPYEIWREKHRLTEVLESVSSAVCADGLPQAMAVTMTAELSDIFATKREGVLYVLESVEVSFPGCSNFALSLSGEFLSLGEAKYRPLDFAATNWLASARWFALKYPDCLIVDVGSTTTDVIPILDGQVAASGRSDTARLQSGELVFTGVLRTNAAAIVQSVPLNGKFCPVASEYFVNSGDVHLILGNLTAEDYGCSTPDGRPASMAAARGRLARLVCADADMLSLAEIEEMALYIHKRQIRQIMLGMERVISRLPRLKNHPVIVLGAGAFMAEEASKKLGMEVADLDKDFSRQKLAVAPCLAAAHLLAKHLSVRSL